MKKRKNDPWMKADVYGQSLQGLTINLISTDLDRTLVFQEHVLGADIVYHDSDFAAIPVSYTHLTLPTNREV